MMLTYVLLVLRSQDVFTIVELMIVGIIRH